MLSRVTKRPLYVHVGSSKTGTSALQRGLWDSVDALAEAGVGVPFVGRDAHLRKLLRPMGWVTSEGFVGPVRRKVLMRLEERLRATPGDRLLVSNEDLCEAGPKQIEAFHELAEAADLEVRVILTARDWSKQLPSEYQQFLKHRMTTDYPTFLEDVRARRGRWGEHFWVRQDVAGICERWGAGLAPQDVHVIPVPPMAVDPDTVFRSFGEVVGYDPARLSIPADDVNASFGVVEAELYRRVNAELGDRLGDYEQEYQPGLRWPLVQGVLPRKASARLTLPPEHVGWVREAGQAQRDAVVARGYAVHGDPDLLVAPADSGAPLAEVDEAEVAAAAVATLANFAVFSLNRSRRLKGRQKGRRQGRGGGDEPATSPVGRVRAWTSSRARRPR